MRAMIVKEFRQLRRDRRTLAMMIVMPILLLVILGYAASFDVSVVPTVVAGPGAGTVAKALPKTFELAGTYPAGGAAAATWARDELRDGHAAVAIVTGTAPRPLILIDGSQLFTAQKALQELAGTTASGQAVTAATTARIAGPARIAASMQILYNPQLKTSYIMIPGLAGVILVFVGTVITSLGVVRERQAGTLELLAVMPLRPADHFLGKIVPYFAVAVADLVVVLAIGVAVFGVPFRGSVAVFGLGALLFVFVTLGLGVLISSVSQTQGQAIQLAVMTLLPQVLTIAENLAFSRAVFAGTGPGSDVPDSLRRYAAVAVRDLPLGVVRRAAFAQVLAHAPELELLDEPTSGVDPLARARLWETISQTAADGAGVIVTTHSMEEAEECTRLVVLAAGRVVATGTAAQIVGRARTAVVRAADWAAALRRLEAAGLRAVLAGTGLAGTVLAGTVLAGTGLAGTALRVPGRPAAEVAAALGDLPATVTTESATLEERFFELAAGG